MKPKDIKGEYNPKHVAKEVEENPASLHYKLIQLYEKPLFQKQTTMNFPEKILANINEGRFPQVINLCSRCHHCR